MPVSIEALGIDRLSVGERLELIEQIWDSLPDQVDPQEVPEWHLVELAKRRARAEAQPGEGKPWREVLDRLEGEA
jgi:putative addiction module component (TIGR02574 family)